MAFKYSTRSIDLAIGKRITVVDAGSQIAFVNATSTITTTEADFLTKGFRPGGVIKVTASTSNNGYYTIVSLTASVITVSESLVDEVASSATPTLTIVGGQSWIDILANGKLCIYGSPIVSDINIAATGTLLAELTNGGGAFTPGSPTNALNFEYGVDGLMSILTGQTWRDSTPAASGTAAYAIYYDNGYITGDDSVNKQSVRAMGTVGVSGSGRDIIISTTAIQTGIPVTCDQCDLTQADEACE